MYETLELNMCSTTTLDPRFTFDDNDQKTGEFGNRFFEDLLQNITFTNYDTDCNTNYALNLWEIDNVFHLASDTNNTHHDVTVEAGVPEMTGDSNMDSQGHIAKSEQTKLGQASAKGSNGAHGETQTSAEVDFTATTMEPQPSADSLAMRKGQPYELFGVGCGGARKRRASTALIEDEDGKERQFTSKSHQNGGEQKRRLACPYRKLDPYQHRDCARYTLHRIKDVKQHIDRRHRKPDVYCSRCFANFPSQTERDEHTRDSRCEILPRPRWQGITDEQREELNKASCRKAPLEQQWYRMWDILFPGEVRPQSAFSGNYIEEVVPVIRHCWIDKSSSIIDNTIQDHGDVDVDKSLLQRLMDSVFDRLEEEVRGTPLTDDFRLNRDEVAQRSQRHHAKRSKIE